MREISLDTETTGLSFINGDKLTEIGAVEIIDKKITGKTFHLYINPERELSEGAAEISGLTREFLKQYKPFRDCYQEFLDFVQNDRLVIHNAPFDIGFLNYELEQIGAPKLNPNNVVDTLVMAKEKFPGSPSTLDALCRRFSVDTSRRTKHGALIDAELLAAVYLHMSVEVFQKTLFGAEDITPTSNESIYIRSNIEPRDFPISDSEKQEHMEFLKKLKNPIWNKLQQ